MIIPQRVPKVIVILQFAQTETATSIKTRPCIASPAVLSAPLRRISATVKSSFGILFPRSTESTLRNETLPPASRSTDVPEFDSDPYLASSTECKTPTLRRHSVDVYDSAPQDTTSEINCHKRSSTAPLSILLATSKAIAPQIEFGKEDASR